MKTAHPSDAELQQYAQDRVLCPEEVVMHVEGCSDCRAGVMAYATLFEGLDQQPAVAFDFDVAELVMAKLPGERNSRYMIAGIIFLVIAIPAYLFRKNAFWVFTGISTLALALILAAAGVFMVLRIMALYKVYQKRLQQFVQHPV
jgi:phosphoglycerol transferase MdoB-like AlkP superfamily enzyme